MHGGRRIKLSRGAHIINKHLMKLRFFAILVLTFFIQLGYAQNDTTYDEMLQSHYRGTVPLMQPEDLYKRMLNGETIHLLDTRESREYKVSALKGATHVGFLFFSSSIIVSHISLTSSLTPCFLPISISCIKVFA